MYCPLCQSEYREGITQCSDCRAALVVALDSTEALANPPRILWQAPIEDLYNAIRNRLEEDRIPCRAIEEESPLLRRIHHHFEIRVLANDFDRALKSGIEAVEANNPLAGWFESCSACTVQQPAGFSKCASCGAWISAPEVATDRPTPQSQDSDGAPTDNKVIVHALGKHCTLCGLVYQTKFTHCSACGIELTDGLAPTSPQSTREAREPIRIVWQGTDPVALSRIICALRRAGIRAFTKSTRDHLVFGIAIPRPRYEINVFKSDYEIARYFINPVRETLAFDQLSEQEGDPIAVQQSPLEEQEPSAAGAASASAPAPAKSTPKWSRARATIEIWSGDDSGIADMLAHCLAENRIRFRCEGMSPSTQHFFVTSEDAAHAAEIVTAIVESAEAPQ
jgi:hypothetical protein